MEKSVSMRAKYRYIGNALLKLGDVSSDDDDVGAFLRQLAADAQAHSTRAAGEEDGL